MTRQPFWTLTPWLQSICTDSMWPLSLPTHTTWPWGLKTTLRDFPNSGLPCSTTNLPVDTLRTLTGPQLVPQMTRLLFCVRNRQKVKVHSLLLMVLMGSFVLTFQTMRSPSKAQLTKRSFESERSKSKMGLWTWPLSWKNWKDAVSKSHWLKFPSNEEQMNELDRVKIRRLIEAEC